MTNSKSTKRTLLTSSISLLLCFAMLLGTTFAWFTDSAVSANNVIKSGNLDVVVEYTLDGENWDDLDGAEDLFNKDLWEPGHTEVAALRIKNNGSLALKYTANMNLVDETIGLTKDGKDIVLSDILTVSTLVQQEGAIGDIALSLAFNGENSVAYEKTAAFKDANVLRADVELLPDKTHYMIVKVDMAETVGNEANHDGKNIPSINFGINVLATQFTYENDTFGKDYDAGAEYLDVVTNAADLSTALAAGESVALGSDLTDVPVNTKAPYGNYFGVAQNGGVFDGNGKTLDFDIGELNGGKVDNYGIMTSGGTIKNVTISGVFRGIVIMNPTEDVILDNVVVGGEDVCYAINTAEGNGKHNFIAKNSTIKGWNSYGTAVKSLSFTNCTFAQGEYYTNVYGRLVKPYVNAVFDSCEFNSKYYIDLSQLGKDGDGKVLDPDAKIVLRNCTVNGVKLTADNWKTLIASESDCGVGQISIEGKDGTYMTASNIFDYVIFE